MHAQTVARPHSKGKDLINNLLTTTLNNGKGLVNGELSPQRQADRGTFPETGAF